MKALLYLTVIFSLSACAAARVQEADPLETVFQRVQRSVVTLQVTTGMEGGVGSGAVISEDGKIMTAAHVVQVAETVDVEFADGTIRKGRVMGTDPLADVAMVQVEGDLPPGAVVAPLGDSDPVRVGSRCFVVGAPHGISHSLTVGHISARRLAPSLVQGIVQIEQFQTDAAINKGNSGGPMFNMKGEIIGVVSYIVSETGGSEGLGFAVTSNVFRALMIDRSPFWTGVEHVLLSGPLAAALNLPDGQSGLLIQRVAKGSPGQAMGLRGGTLPVTIGDQTILLGGDIVIEVLGIGLVDVDAWMEIREKMSALEPGDEIRVRIIRAGKTYLLRGKVGS